MDITTLVVGDMETNCYLAWCSQYKEAIIIDPGADPEDILKAVGDLGLKVKYIVNTHGHLDHIGANRELNQALACPIAIGEGDSGMLNSAKSNLSHFVGKPVTSPVAELILQEGGRIEFGACILTVLSTPGHTRGGISLYGHGTLFAGDTLFQRSIGRSDLPGGDQSKLLKSIHTKLLTLPDETRVLPGHGPETTIAQERLYNPWLQG